VAKPVANILSTEALSPDARRRLETVGRIRVLDPRDEEELCEAVGEAEALLVRTKTRVTRRVIESAPKLKVIGRGGSGLDNIDVPAAWERGVTVVYTPEASTDAVADLTVGLMIAVLRGIALADAGVRGGRFDEARAACVGPELRGLTLGIVGMGRIGRAVSSRCHFGFRMAIVYNDILEVEPLPFPAQSHSKEALFERADVISVHVPLTDETRGMIDGRVLAGFKPRAVLINTARGEVVDSVALAEALSEGRLGGAALDVFDAEPLPANHPLLSAPNTLLTPHIGARTPESLARMDSVVDDVIAVLKGRTARFPAR